MATLAFFALLVAQVADRGAGETAGAHPAAQPVQISG